MAEPVRRFLIVPDDQFTPEMVLRACLTSDRTTHEEAGRSIRPPEVDTDNRPAGEIRPTLSGRPEGHVAGSIRLAAGGPLDRGRWGWCREDDDESFDLQFRQSCRVLGRRPDVLRYDDDGSGTPYSCRPKMLSLKSGRALLGYLQTSNLAAYAGFGGFATTAISLLDPDTDAWSDPANISAEGLTELDVRQGFDFVQFPDTGEVLMFTLVQDDTSPAERRLYVHSAQDTDDWDGTTWTQRMSLNVATVNTRFAIRTDGDSSSFAGCAAELLASGRIMLVVATFKSLWSFVSDDRGTTWSATKIADHDAAHIDGGQNVTCCRMRNDRALIVATCRLSNSDRPTCKLYVTVDGVRFGTEQDLVTGATYALGVLDVAVVMRPDGYPQLYGTAHSLGSTASAWYDALVCMSGVERDPPVPNSTSPTDYFTGEFYTMHLAEGGGEGAYRTDPTAVRYQGFVDIEAISHRGQILLATQVVRQGGSDSDPTFGSAALMMYRTAHWQPCREALTNAGGEPISSARGRIYNRTWEPYGLPTDWGFSVLGGGSETIVAGGAEGGYLQVETVSAARNFGDTTLPASGGGLDGAVRFVFQVVSGGSQSTDAVAVKLYLASGGTGLGVHVRGERTVSGTKVGLYDGVTLNPVGSQITVDNDQWIEVLVAIADGDATMMVRGYDRDEDPDWDGPYQQTGGALSSGTLTDLLAFGTFSTVTAKSRWKTLQLHRSASSFATLQTPLTRKSASFVDDQNDGTVQPGRSAVIDDGIDNYLRCSQITSDPPQFLSRGVLCRWRGEAITEGTFTHEVGYDYGRGNILELPVTREWRSASTGNEIEIVFDAGASGTKFRPDAIALFGRNFPRCTIELNDTDSWGSPTVRQVLTYSEAGTLFDGNRCTEMWSYSYDILAVVSGKTYTISEHRLTMSSPHERGPWRPSQFRSLRTGPRFYVVFKTVTGDHVFRIEDNTGDTLILHSLASDADGGPVAHSNGIGTASFAIFSDRLAYIFGPRYDTYDVAPQTGFRYLRLVLPACTHHDDDEAFYRLGYAVLGRAVEISTPDAAWGWQVGIESGNQVYRADGGASYARRRHSPRRTFSFGYGLLMPPAEASFNTFSPAQQPAKRTWGHWLDTVRRLEVDGLPVALVWGEGNRAVGQAADEGIQMVASDPDGLVLARLASPGTLEHIFWDCRTLNLASGDAAVPRPVARVSGITFVEEF